MSLNVILRDILLANGPIFPFGIMYGEIITKLMLKCIDYNQSNSNISTNCYKITGYNHLIIINTGFE